MKVQSVETGWAVVDTKMNRIVTFGSTRKDAWCAAFYEVAGMIGGDDFVFKYWKLFEPSVRASAKHGIKLVRATRTVEVKIK